MRRYDNVKPRQSHRLQAVSRRSRQVSSKDKVNAHIAAFPRISRCSNVPNSQFGISVGESNGNTRPILLQYRLVNGATRVAGCWDRQWLTVAVQQHGSYGVIGRLQQDFPCVLLWYTAVRNTQTHAGYSCSYISRRLVRPHFYMQ